MRTLPTDRAAGLPLEGLKVCASYEPITLGHPLAIENYRQRLSLEGKTTVATDSSESLSASYPCSPLILVKNLCPLHEQKVLRFAFGHSRLAFTQAIA